MNTREVINRAILTAVLLVAFSISNTRACSSVIVGKNASANGYVLLGHTEDIDPHPAINHYKVPRKQYNSGDVVTLREGGVLDQVDETWEYIWSQVPGEKFCDGYLNEWGVAIVSNRCPSKEDKSNLTNGGIGYMLRQLVAQRATSAREGVKMAGELVEKFGYHSTGRTYSICDPEEGWVFCAMRGRHWLAYRVPDDEVAIIANSYTVRSVDLSDASCVMASDDLLEYATSRGWYVPGESVEFDFATTFADTVAAAASYNVCRQWTGLRQLVKDTVPANWSELPFSLKPDMKLSVADVIGILRNHYENTVLYRLPSDSSSPHENQFMTPCSQRSRESIVFELRKDLPKDIGLVYWVSLGKPCYSFLVPFYFGLNSFPQHYFTQEKHPADSTIAAVLALENISELEQAFWKFSNYSHRVDSNYADFGKAAELARDDYERRVMEARHNVESAAIRLYQQNPIEAVDMLMAFSADQYLMAVNAMEAVLATE